MESKAAATLGMFRVSSLKSSGILTKFLANKSIRDTGLVRIVVNRHGEKKKRQRRFR